MRTSGAADLAVVVDVGRDRLVDELLLFFFFLGLFFLFFFLFHLVDKIIAVFTCRIDEILVLLEWNLRVLRRSLEQLLDLIERDNRLGIHGWLLSSSIARITSMMRQTTEPPT